MNGLLDRATVEALYAASKAGVEIDLIIRGMCSLRPGVKGLSERIRVRSIVGRFLEHSRIFDFANGGKEEIYCGSADWMPRNLFERLFGDGSSDAERLAHKREDRSILDSVTQETSRLQKGLGAQDKARISDYLDNVREIERRIQKVEARNMTGDARDLPAAPAGGPPLRLRRRG